MPCVGDVHRQVCKNTLICEARKVSYKLGPHGGPQGSSLATAIKTLAWDTVIGRREKNRERARGVGESGERVWVLSQRLRFVVGNDFCLTFMRRGVC